ncbi:conserved hypothetical protein [Frankia canadensis]|uniref:Uncharacterized protein n=1 Tax=Frankia canadensis TaxID=1836972 RepID=A0A2I2KLP4_9ACTN|nr:SCO5389 family protein [Frankia canadensis]SNQ46580.1 conserved hypothetical protein [Frankia canadensis]SOU53870.1 conserved hypothetical protein [Frankia canadensis]
MSLTVSPDLLAAAEAGDVDDDAFVACVRDSLPYAYGLVADLAGRLSAPVDLADNLVAPPDERAQGELLRAMASTAIRGALERHFGVALAFQNCHRVAAFRPQAVGGEAYRRFVSVEGQVLNQQPEFVNC